MNWEENKLDPRNMMLELRPNWLRALYFWIIIGDKSRRSVSLATYLHWMPRLRWPMFYLRNSSVFLVLCLSVRTNVPLAIYTVRLNCRVFFSVSLSGAAVTECPGW